MSLPLARTRFYAAMAGIGLLSLSACSALSEGQKQIIFTPGPNGVEARSVSIGPATPPADCDTFDRAAGTRCESEEFSAASESLLRAQIRPSSMARATFAQAGGVCDEHRRVLERLYAAQLQDCTARPYIIESRKGDPTLAYDFVLIEKDCQHSRCAPFGLIDGLELSLDRAELEAEESNNWSLSADAAITKVTTATGHFVIIDTVQAR